MSVSPYLSSEFRDLFVQACSGNRLILKIYGQTAELILVKFFVSIQLWKTPNGIKISNLTKVKDKSHGHED